MREREEIVERSKFRAGVTDLGLRLILLGRRALGLGGGGGSSGGRRPLGILIQRTGRVPSIAVELTAILILPRRRRSKTRGASDDVEESPDVRRRKLLVVVLCSATGRIGSEK